MAKFKAYRVHNEDGAIQGRIETLTVDDLSPGEVLIKVDWSSVNYKDALAATGSGKIIHNFPCVAGIDAAGHVMSSADERFHAGDAVLVTGYDFGVDHDGGYAEYARVPAEWAIPIPDGMTPYDAMALGTAGLTVAQCVQRLEDNHQNPENGPIVVTGATGGVGSLAIDILSGLGYEVVALTGKEEAHELLQLLGANESLDRKSLDLEGPPLGKSQWGGAIDNVGGDVLGWLTRTVKPWGNIVSVGLAGGTHLNTTVIPFILRGIGLLGVSSAACPTDLRHRLWQRLATDLAPRHLDKIVTRVASMDELPEIFNTMLAGKSMGRTVVKIGD